jgi:hypothetical protein
MFAIIVIQYSKVGKYGGSYMKTLAKKIEVLATFDTEGNISPLRFKAKTKTHEDIIISIDTIKSKEFEKIAGNEMLLYRCKGIVNDKERDFELKFEIMSCKWILWKM